MLSPQFYVIKSEEVPVKYLFQAKKLAPSVLDDLSNGEKMTYEVFRDDDKWVFIAYDLHALAGFLESKGGSIDKVGHIYFAEQSRAKFTPPVVLDKKEMLSVVNDTVTVVPKHLFAQTDHFAEFDDSFRPEKSFRIQRSYSSYIDTRQAIVLAGLLGILGVAYFAEGYRYRQAVDRADAKLANLLSGTPSLQGAYARDSIYKKYISINKEQRAIRDRIKSIGRMTSKKTRIQSMSVDASGYKISLDIPNDAKIVKSLRAIAKKEGFGKLSIQGSKLTAEGKFQ
jgi:hypothetical protein